MKKGCKIVLIISCLLLLLVICSLAGYFIYNNLTIQSGPVAYSFEIGEATMDTVESVGVEGSTIVTPDGSTSIYLPPGSIDIGEHFSIWHQPILSSNIPEFATVHGDMIVLERDQPVDFLKPVAVTLPIDKTLVGPEEIVAVYQYLPEDGIIEATTMIDYNYEAGYVTFATTHFSNYVRISTSEEKIKDALENGYDTGFKPSEYGWYIRNWGSFETVGHCMGMSAVSKWYYNYKDKISGANLYDRYKEGIMDQEFDDVVAHELAGRVDVMLEPRFNSFKSDMADLGYDYDGIKNLYPKLILQNMVLTGQPEMLYIRKATTIGSTTAATQFAPGINHALLAYKYKDGKMFLYDPNFAYRPNGDANQNERSVPFSFTNGFGTYYSGLTSADSKHQFNAFIPFSTGFVTGERKIKELMSMSTQRFPDDYYPEIVVDSVEELTPSKIKISGRVVGTKYTQSTRPKFVHAYLNNYTLEQDHPKSSVTSSGGFTLEVETGGSGYTVHLLAADSTGTLSWSAYKMITSDVPTTEPVAPIVEEEEEVPDKCLNYRPYDIPDNYLDGWACEEYDYNLRLYCANRVTIDSLDEAAQQEFWDQQSELRNICGLEK